jgi:S-adenosylmethionine/arginine decarboxylase-like enzyme
MKLYLFTICTYKKIQDPQKLVDALCRAATHRQVGDSTVISLEPGMTILAALIESHLAIHTYPEDGRVYVDLFTCKNLHPRQLIEIHEVLTDTFSTEAKHGKVRPQIEMKQVER